MWRVLRRARESLAPAANAHAATARRRAAAASDARRSVVDASSSSSSSSSSASRSLSTWTLSTLRATQRRGGSSSPSLLPWGCVSSGYSRGYRGNGKRKDGGYGTLVPRESPIPPQGVISLSNLKDNPGSKTWRLRVGRGRGGGMGKTARRGYNGQKSRSGGAPRIGFEGGQTPLRLTLPKRGFVNPKRMVFTPLNLWKLQKWIDDGRLDVSKTLTMKDFVDARLIDPRVKNGLKLLAKEMDGHAFTAKINVEVSRVSAAAKEAIEKNGGSVVTVHYNRLGLRALFYPQKFKYGLPKPARAPPWLVGKVDRVGTLPAPAPREAASAEAS